MTKSTKAEQLVEAIMACVEDYGLTAPSIDRERAIKLAEVSLKKAYDAGYDRGVESMVSDD